MSTYLRWQQLTPAELETQYSPSSCLPGGDYRPAIAEFKRRSEEVWDTLLGRNDVVTRTVPYGDSPAQTLDIAIPSKLVRTGQEGTGQEGTGQAGTGQKGTVELAPALIFLHGGYWQELSKTDSLFAGGHCIDAGMAFVAVDYTLAPHASLDAIVDECTKAVNLIIERGPDWGIDPARVVLAGSSAGAHLAAMICPSRPPIGRALLSGVFDLEPLVSTSINTAVGLDTTAARRLSPLRRPVVDRARTVLAFGRNETEQFKAQTQVYADYLIEIGVEVTLVEAVDRNHFDIVFDLADPTTALGRAVIGLSKPTP